MEDVGLLDELYIRLEDDRNAAAMRERTALQTMLSDQRFTPADYRRFELPKKGGGTRPIAAPNARLMRVLKYLYRQLLDSRAPASSAAHAYYHGRSIRTMAEPHVGRRWVLKLDLKGFFPNIGHALVGKAIAPDLPLELRSHVRKWCFLEGGLPQGAPTSPILSNLTAGRLLDRRLLGICAVWRTPRSRYHHHQLRVAPIAYTRYADDLCFSSDYPYLPEIVPLLRNIVEAAGFTVNEDKLRLMHAGGRQTICGVALNVRIGKPRRYRRSLRSRLHQYAVNIVDGRCPPGMCREGAPGAERLEPLPLARLRGQLEHIRFLNPDQAAWLERWWRLLSDLCGPPAAYSAETLHWISCRHERSATR